MKQKILVPCDYSELSLDALHFACGLARKSTGEVHVLTVIGDTPAHDERLQKTYYQTRFRQIADSGLFTGIVVNPLLQTGGFTQAVLETIVRLEISQLVIGTKGARGWDGVFAGSYAGKLVRTSPVPVFTVKRRTEPEEIRNIVFPCNLEWDTDTFIDAIKGMQELFQARLNVLRVVTEGRKEADGLMSDMQDFARFHRLKRCSLNIRRDDDERTGIIRFATEIGADMIAMATHGRDLSHLHLTSIAADVVNHSRIPTWTYALIPG